MSAPEQTSNTSNTSTAPAVDSSSTGKAPEYVVNVFNCVTFAITGKTLSRPHHEIEKLITESGGHFSNKITVKTDYLITNDEGYHEMSRLTQQAEHKHIVVLEERFIYDCVSKRKFLPIKKYIIEHHEKRGVVRKSSDEEEVDAKWAWKSEAGWCQFVRVMNERIENAYEHYKRTGRNKNCEIDTLRRVDFESMLVHSARDTVPFRRIKREAVIPKETKKNKRVKVDEKEKEKEGQASTSTTTQQAQSALPINA